MNNRILDIFLAIIIVACSGYIGFRVFSKQIDHTRPQGTLSEQLTADTNLKASPTVPINAIQNRVVIAQEHIAMVQLTQNDWWGHLLRTHQLKSFSTEASQNCQHNVAPLKYYPITSPNLKNVFESQSLVLLLDSKNSFCIKTGETFIAYYTGLHPNEAALQIISNATIEGLVQIPAKQISDELIQQLNSDRKSFMSAFFDGEDKVSSNLSLIKIRVQKIHPESPDKPLPTYRRTQVLHADTLESWLSQKNSNYIVLDIRSRAERASEPLRIKASQIVAAEYQPHHGDHLFNFNRTVNDVFRDSFHTGPILNAMIRNDAAILVIGSGPTDGRPVWALQHLIDLPVKSLNWFYDGVTSFNDTISK
jgi:hypothetical protein